MDTLQNILAGYKRNDRKSQEALYCQFYPAMYNLCKKFFADDHDIQTGLNNGMMKVFKNINQYDSSKGNFFNWVYTIVRNACLTILRDQQNDIKIEFKEDMPEIADGEIFEAIEWEEVFHCLDKLPPTTRAVCSLFYLEGFSIREICDEMHIKDGTVKWHLNESRNRLKNIFMKSKES